MAIPDFGKIKKTLSEAAMWQALELAQSKTLSRIRKQVWPLKQLQGGTNFSQEVSTAV